MASTAFQVSAQDFPKRAITKVMPYAAGGPGDTITRVFAGAMQKHLGQQIVVDNTAGASGSIGTAKVARSKPDVHGRSRFAKLSIHDDSKVKIAPVHSDFWCDF
jgi:tripartite-type tricarboxylate transporter receptor subunit TctC